MNNKENFIKYIIKITCLICQYPYNKYSGYSNSKVVKSMERPVIVEKGHSELIGGNNHVSPTI